MLSKLNMLSGSEHVETVLCAARSTYDDKNTRKIIAGIAAGYIGYKIISSAHSVIDKHGLFAKTRLGALDNHRISNTTGGDVVANVLNAHGVDTVFTLSGGHISAVIVGCEKVGIKVIDVRHEANSVFAADAYARLSGNVGVAVVTAGPGVTNTVTPMKNAQMAQSPVVLIGGAAATISKGRGALQDIDQVGVLKTICKHTVIVNTTRHLESEVSKAIHIARSGVPGPVFIEIPIDCQWPYADTKKEISGMKPSGSGLVSNITSWYFDCYIHNIFAKMPPANNKITVTPPNIPKADTSLIKKVKEILKSAKKPVIVFASQSTLRPEKLTTMVDIVTKYNIPCFTSGMARGLFGKSHKLFFRHCRRHALKNADVIILLGVTPDFRLGYGKSLSKKATKIMVNLSKEDAWKNTDAMWMPDYVSLTDPSEFLISLKKELGFYYGPESWVNELRKLDDAKDGINAQRCQQFSQIHINPLRLLKCLNNILPKNSTLITDGGDFIGSAAYLVQPRKPLGWLDPGAFGTLGVGGGFALAAAHFHRNDPDHEIWLLWGDGSCGFTISEIDTMSRFNLPVIVLIGNDAAWQQILRAQEPVFKSGVGCKLVYTRYEQAAEGLGAAKGYFIDKLDTQAETDEEQCLRITNVLKEARTLAKKQKKPVVVNCLIGETDFRAGSLSV